MEHGKCQRNKLFENRIDVDNSLNTNDYKMLKQNLTQYVRENKSDLFIELLDKNKCSFNRLIIEKNFNGDTFVHLAALYGCVGVLKYYYDFKKDIFECRNRDGKTALHIAAQSSQLECVQYLLSCNVCVNALKRSDWTPLMLACTQSNVKIVREILLYGADLNMINKDGWTAFHIASREGNIDSIRCLLEFNPLAWRTKSKNGRTPLHSACLCGHIEVVKFLVENANYEINMKDSCGRTPLMDAVSGEYNEIVEFLIETGALIEDEDKLGKNLLHLAAEAGNLDCITLLVKKKYFNINSQTSEGLSPLHLACKQYKKDSVYLLVELGADCNLKDKQGRIALDYIIDEQHQADFVSLLEKR
ncbi:ankyrin repeat domain-containing protein 16 [Caerostris darwini]|uniref:Ankyrin repeat domain-containing protein 16 n=1 Tax=Caerostris darwini TaxID=1538125 RepID=A0AAV4U6A4_9ARAC|nr:ankyrin repeat domain-containing protein 16 [Caerostris darwini]